MLKRLLILILSFSVCCSADMIMTRPKRYNKPAPAPSGDTSLLSWWKCDEGTGTSLTDSGTKGNNGAFDEGTPEWVTNDGHTYIKISYLDTLYFGANHYTNTDMANFTITCWAKPYWSGGGTGDSMLFWIFMVPATWHIANAWHWWQGYGGNHLYNDYPTTAELQRVLNIGNAWHMLTRTYNGTTVKTFVDAVDQSWDINAACNFETAGEALWVGKYGASATKQGFCGFRIYNRVLTQAELNALYAAGR